MRSHGPAAVVAAIEEGGYSYPVSVSRLRRELTTTNVDIDERGNSTTLTELLAGVDAQSFEDEADVRATLEPVFRRERERRRGRLGRLRARLRRLVE